MYIVSVCFLGLCSVDSIGLSNAIDGWMLWLRSGGSGCSGFCHPDDWQNGFEFGVG